jgi:hypothetical protein
MLKTDPVEMYRVTMKMIEFNEKPIIFNEIDQFDVTELVLKGRGRF